MWKSVLFFVPIAYGFVQIPKGYRNTCLVMDKKHYFYEKPMHFLSDHDFVFYYGDRDCWWGDINACETRSLYHKLLPTYHSFYRMDYDLYTLALKTFETRKAAKAYVRRLSFWHVRMSSIVFDKMRNVLVYNRWKDTTFEELWDKYEKQVRQQYPHLDVEKLHEETALTLIHKSCCTNQWVDTHFLETI